MKSGFTVMEAAVGLAVLSLALGGLTASLSVFGRLQRAAGGMISEGRVQALAQRGLADLMQAAGPVRSDQPSLRGAARQLAFDCGAAQPCGAWLSRRDDRDYLDLAFADGERLSRPLDAGGVEGFVYQGELSAYPTWPPEGQRQLLTSVRLTGRGGSVIAAAPLWRQQPAACQYDLIAGDCRSPAP